MRYILLALLLAACSAPTPISRATQGASVSPQTVTVDAAGRACVDHAIHALFAAMNAGIGEGAVMYPEEGVMRLVARSRAGERWTLLRLDVNGPLVDCDGKGALDCPDEKFLVFFAT